MSKKVVVIQRHLTHYRKPFFENLKNRLEKEQIQLILIHGNPSRTEVSKKDDVNLDWAIHVNNKYIPLTKDKTLLWQPCMKHLRGAELIIVEQASSLLLNYLLLIYQFFGVYKVAFWGHGRNFQSHKAHRAGERIKKLISKKAHWWFAYNDLSKKAILQLGYAPERVTSVFNAIDTRPLIKSYEEMSVSRLDTIKSKYSINGRNLCICSSSMYKEKRVDFLIEACKIIRTYVPDFEMVIIGKGPEENILVEAAAANNWIHYLGALFDTDKVPFFKLAKLMLLPGLVGLSVVDSFALETPLITTDIDYHSPEIDYLEHEKNGMIISPHDDVQLYAQVVVDLLNNEDMRLQLVEGCREAREKYTIDNMSQNFADAILKALNS